MFYNRVVLITNKKFIPSSVFIELSRMYEHICVKYVKTTRGMKDTIDSVYRTENGNMLPVPVYVYTHEELHVLVKAALRRYCNSLGITDICFKAHIHI